MKRLLISAAFGLLLGAAGIYALLHRGDKAPRVDVSQAAVVTRMQALGSLETSQFTIEKIISADKNANANPFSKFLFGDKLLMVAHGEVIAGFNLAALKAEDVAVNGSALSITLPPAQILHVSLDNEKTRVYDRSTGILSRPDKDLESDARLAAEQSIRAAACESNILDEATENARKQIEALFKALDFASVTVNAPTSLHCE